MNSGLILQVGRNVALLLAVLSLFLIFPSAVVAQTQSHPLSQVSPIDTDLNMNSRNISSLNYLLYSGGIFYSGSQGIPTADIAASSITGAKIASSVITASKLSNPLGGSLNGSAYYDSDNSNYFLDPASSGDALLVAGDVGIGTTNPSFKLDVDDNVQFGLNQDLAPDGTGLVGQLLVDGNGYASFWAMNGTAMYLGHNSAARGFGLLTDETTRLFIASDGDVTISGDVGIGPATPLTRLHVRNSTDTDLEIARFDSAGGSGSVQGKTYIGLNHFTTGSTFPSARIGVEETDLSDWGASLVFQTRSDDSDVVPTTKVIITEAGRVGINSSTPVKTLDITGDLNVTGTIYGAINTTGDVNCTECVGTADIASSAVTTAKIANSAVTSAKLASPLGGSVNATAYYDSDNSAYYLDPAATGTAFSSAGSIILNNNEFLYGKNSVSSDSLLIGRNSTDTLQVGDRAFNNPMIITTGNNFMALETNGAERMRVDGSGNVGIGTTSTGAKLHVQGDSQVSYGVYDTPLRVVGDTYSYIEVVGTNTQAGIVLNRDGNTGWLTGINADGKLRMADLATIDQTGLTNAKDGAEGITILSDGSVGINTTSPSYTLQVGGGDVYLDTSKSKYRINAGGGNIGWLASTGTGLELEVGASTYGINISQAGTPRITLSGDGNIGLTKTPDSNARLNIEFADNTFAIKGSRSGTELFGIHANSLNPVSFQSIGARDLLLETSQGGNAYIYLQDSSSNVGIGTTTPTHKLQVVGGTNLSATTTSLASVVFGTDLFGQIEFRGNTPYFDFSNAASDDYDVRLMLTGNDVLNVDGGNLNVTGNYIYLGNSGGYWYADSTNHVIGVPGATGSWQVKNSTGSIKANIDYAGTLDLLGSSGSEGGQINIHNSSSYSGGQSGAWSIDVLGNDLRTYYDSGSVALFIEGSNNNVGIGTTTPSHKLHIGSGAVRYNPGTDQNLYLTTGFNLATAMRIQSENDAGSSLKGLELRANPIILVDGDVGVQTTTPQSALHINGTGSTYLQLDVNATVLASTDCDAESERGRTIVDGSNVRLHICYGTSGWKTLTPA